MDGDDEPIFRLLNEREGAEELEDEPVPDGKPVFVCECARPECVENLELTRDEWDALRKLPGCFAVKLGHQIPALEEVVERREGYLVVRRRSRA